MFKGLYQRLAIILLIVFIIQGVALLWIVDKSFKTTQKETEQKLHLNLAEYVVNELGVFRDDQFNEQMIKDAFHHIMALGPATELYVLDTNGKILTYDAPDAKIKRQYIDLKPIKQFIDKEALPILGDDPRSKWEKKIFSAATVLNQSQQLKGYLYIIIGGEDYDNIVTDLLFSKVWKISLFSVLTGLIFLLIATLLLFYAMTRPLNRLCREVIAFEASDFQKLPNKKHIFNENSKNELKMLENQVFLMEQRIVTQLDNIKQQDKLRREFFAYVSHDLRTPLAGMRAYLETLLDQQVILTEQEKHKFIENILLNNKRLSDMVDELFELARLEHGEIEIQQENFVLSDLLSDLYASLSPLANEKGIHLVMDCPNMSLMVYADVARLERILQNLISNAIYYTPAGGTVTTLISQKADQPVDISIQDTGNGIPAKELPYVFEPYYRAIDGKKVRQDGCGLGLAITQRLLALHHSELRVESQQGQGARFYFSLEVYQP